MATLICPNCSQRLKSAESMRCPTCGTRVDSPESTVPAATAVRTLSSSGSRPVPISGRCPSPCRTPVRAIVELWRQGVPPEQISSQLPHLSMAQVFDVLSYYSDHQAEINRSIERNRIPDDLIDPLIQGS